MGSSGEEFSLNNLPKFSIFSDPEIEKSRFFKKLSKLEVDEDAQSLFLSKHDDPLVRNYRDQINEYNLNTMGYRSKEFKHVPLVTAGCSVTFGVGVPYSGVWSTLLAETLNLEHVNLATPGWSAESIVDNLFRYFYQYGNPKIAVVLFPDTQRATMISDRDYSVVSPDMGDPPIKIVESSLYTTPTKTRPNYSKKPHDLLQFIPPEYGVYSTFKAINSLIIYCKSAGIELFWSTWDPEMDLLVSAAKEDWAADAYSNYVSYSKDPPATCHQELLDVFGENFYSGYDGISETDSSNKQHPGVHYHVHVCETFYEKIEKIS
jgi:hypothetical protein